jgi:hypothetical protein
MRFRIRARASHVKPEIRREIKSWAVKEFGGIDHLPDDISVLMDQCSARKTSIMPSHLLQNAIRLERRARADVRDLLKDEKYSI